MKQLSRLITISLLTVLAVSQIACSYSSHNNNNTLWPQQTAPEKIVRIENANRNMDQVLAQSLSGLAAQAVNNATHDELVWIAAAPEDEKLYKATKKRLRINDVRQAGLWQLLDEYHNKGIVRGYIVYKSSSSDEDQIDQSINVATTLAGVLKGAIIEESMVDRAQTLGLKQLADAREKTIGWSFEKYKSQLNRNYILAQSPDKPFMRDVAIAHKCIALYGLDLDGVVPKIMEWLEPPAPILGWNKGDEGIKVSFASKWGPFATASDWVRNLPFISAGISEKAAIKPFHSVKPWEIDYNQGKDFVAFWFSDGDNMGWMMRDFLSSDRYWNNPSHGEFPITWSTCAVKLAQVSPESINTLSRTQPPSTTMSEFSGGYFYPDLFAVNRPNREELLVKKAQAISEQLSKTGIRTLCFIAQDIRSEEAMQAYRIFAEEIDGLIGMIVLQYHPYTAAQGHVFWVENSQGIEIPVVNVRFATWRNARWVGGGSPPEVAQMANELAQEQEEPTFSIIANHAWSRYDKNDNEVAGLNAVKWLVDELDQDIQVINTDEMIWRIRMQNAPEQTRKVIRQMRREQRP